MILVYFFLNPKSLEYFSFVQSNDLKGIVNSTEILLTTKRTINYR